MCKIKCFAISSSSLFLRLSIDSIDVDLFIIPDCFKVNKHLSKSHELCPIISEIPLINFLMYAGEIPMFFRLMSISLAYSFISTFWIIGGLGVTPYISIVLFRMLFEWIGKREEKVFHTEFVIGPLKWIHCDFLGRRLDGPMP